MQNERRCIWYSTLSPRSSVKAKAHLYKGIQIILSTIVVFDLSWKLYSLTMYNFNDEITKMFLIVCIFGYCSQYTTSSGQLMLLKPQIQPKQKASRKQRRTLGISRPLAVAFYERIRSKMQKNEVHWLDFLQKVNYWLVYDIDCA